MQGFIYCNRHLDIADQRFFVAEEYGRRECGTYLVRFLSYRSAGLTIRLLSRRPTLQVALKSFPPEEY